MHHPQTKASQIFEFCGEGGGGGEAIFLVNSYK